jgi:hypothetical protein
MFDASLSFEIFIPPANTTITVSAMDLGVDITPFSDNWRQGRLRVTWPALPAHTNPALNITITLVDSGDGGATFQSGATGLCGLLPLVQIQIPGIAVTGATANYSDIALPPGLRGPIGLAVAAPAGVGDCTAASITAGWGSN